jgi:hypothetical protein
VKTCQHCKSENNSQYKTLCSACYNRKRYNEHRYVREAKKKATYKWMKEHPEQWKVIYTKAIKKYNKKV